MDIVISEHQKQIKSLVPKLDFDRNPRLKQQYVPSQLDKFLQKHKE